MAYSSLQLSKSSSYYLLQIHCIYLLKRKIASVITGKLLLAIPGKVKYKKWPIPKTTDTIYKSQTDNQKSLRINQYFFYFIAG